MWAVKSAVRVSLSRLETSFCFHSDRDRAGRHHSAFQVELDLPAEGPAGRLPISMSVASVIRKVVRLPPI